MSDAEYNNMTPRQMEFAVFCVMCVAEELQNRQQKYMTS